MKSYRIILGFADQKLTKLCLLYVKKKKKQITNSSTIKALINMVFSPVSRHTQKEQFLNFKHATEFSYTADCQIHPENFRVNRPDMRSMSSHFWQVPEAAGKHAFRITAIELKLT